MQFFALSKIYIIRFQFLKAAKIFRRERKFLEASENFESGLDFMRAVDCLLQSNRYDKALKVIAKCEILRQDENELPIVSLPRLDQRDESICYQAAEYYLKRGQLDLMTSALEKLPETKDRITFLKKNGCDEQAAELLLKEGKAEEAAKLMRANGKFLEATSFTDDDKFAAECYLIAARTSVLFKENNETTVSDEETKKLIEVPLRRAYELYEKCDDLNGQAEVKFLRSKFYGNVKDLQEAGRLYYRAQNYAGLAECFLLLMDMEKDPKMFPRSIAINTVNSLLYLILALHKKNRESIDGKAISMCETHFGLVDTEDTGTRRIPRLEMVRFSHIQTEEEIKNEEIDLDEAYNVIREHLYKMASELIMQVWDKHQRINEQYKPCSRYLSDSDLCKEESCTNYHGDLTRQHFADRFYALCFLIQLDAMVDKFLKDLKRESAKVTYRLRESLPFRFKACRWLEELLFPRIGQLGQSYIITENDIRFLREGKFIRDRIIEYAKMDLWYGASEEERWSDSDLYITVSNLMHLAAAPVAEIFSLLSVEERKFEAIENSDRSRDRYGFFPDKRKVGCFEIFTKWLEHSKNALYRRCDVLSASHSAVKTFLFTPARRSSMPYPSIANAVMILEYYMTACLMLYTRLMMNGIPICLPASYLSLIKFWDIVNRSKSNQSTVCSAIQRHAAAFQVEERLPVLDRLHRLTESMVMLMFGGISKRYNIFSAALGNKSVNWGEAERTLILALTMLCNCGRGIPEPCEVLIRQQFLMLQSRDYLPYKLSQCIEAVRHSHGIFDVVNALEKLLKRKPRQEKLFDVRWNEISGREIYRNCQTDFYLRNFRFLINIDELLRDLEHNWDSRESKDARAKDDFLDDFQQNFGEEEAYNKTLEDKNDEKVRKRACLTIERAFCNWMKRKMSTVKKNKKIKSDPVELHFQNFKLDKSGCTICGNEQFEDRSLELSDTSISLQPSSPDNVEETSSNWHSRPIKRSTFISHCSRGNPHWPTEKQFKKFKAYYKSEIYPNLERARQLKVEMELLKNKTGITCSLDLDRLGQAVSRLQTEVKKVEKECAWAKDKSVGEAVGEVIKRISRIQTIKNCKGK